MFNSSNGKSANLKNLLWQVPYPVRNSILQAQQKMIDVQTAKDVATIEANNNTFEISADEGHGDFEPEEDTDLNEEELDENFSRKMSIRALNVAMLHRFSPGSITDRVSKGVSIRPSDHSGLPPRPTKNSMLLRASNLLIN